jgi:uroporphyrinogen-III synthase
MSCNTTRVVKMGIDYGDVQLLCTKSVDSQLLSDLASKRIYVDVVPFTAVVPLINNYLIQHIHQLAEEKIIAIFTCTDAVKAVANILNKTAVDWQIACLDKSTHYAVQDAFPNNNIITIAKDEMLLGKALINQNFNSYTPIYFCGNKRSETIPMIFRSASIKLDEVMVYQTMVKASEISKLYQGILFYSPSAVDSYFVFNNFPNNTIAFCADNNTAEALTKKLSQPAIVVQAADATDASLIESAIVYFNK